MRDVDKKKLDPRLRRMLAVEDAPPGDDTVTAEGRRSFEAVGEDVRRRVLVELDADGPVPDVPGVRWAQIVERIYSADVPFAGLPALAAAPAVKRVEAGRRWYPLLDLSAGETGVDRVHAPPTGSVPRHGAGVVVGIIDFGLDYTLDDFRDEDGRTRVAFLWDQALGARGGEVSPTDFGYGVEYTRDAIDRALEQANPFEHVRHRPAPASHGTHVASIAAGNGRSADAAFPPDTFVGAAPKATIVFVQPDSGDQNSSFTDSSNVADAIAYVFAKARELDLPCVCNMSLGQNGGSHDGESVVERAIDRLLEPRGRTFVSAAGNEHVWRGHASGRLATGERRTLRWHVGGDALSDQAGDARIDRTANEIEIWYSSRDRLGVRVLDPDGRSSSALVPGGQPILERIGSSGVLFADSERFTVLNGDARIYLEIERQQGPLRTGVWTVELEALEAVDGAFDAWIERDTRDPRNDFADQSFFVGVDFEPSHTLGTPATSRRSIAVANYDRRTLAPAASSSRGPTRDGRTKPEVAAPGTRILAAHALGGTPDPSGSGPYPMRVRKSGTSMAAPQVAGIVALLLEEEPTLTAAQIRAILVASANNPDGGDRFDAAWGFGRVNAARALALLRGDDPPFPPA